MDQATPKNKIIFGVSDNAVRTQIYTAIIAYTLVAIIKFENLLYQDVKDQNHIQLKINLI